VWPGPTATINGTSQLSVTAVKPALAAVASLSALHAVAIEGATRTALYRSTPSVASNGSHSAPAESTSRFDHISSVTNVAVPRTNAICALFNTRPLLARGRSSTYPATPSAVNAPTFCLNR